MAGRIPHSRNEFEVLDFVKDLPKKRRRSELNYANVVKPGKKNLRKLVSLIQKLLFIANMKPVNAIVLVDENDNIMLEEENNIISTEEEVVFASEEEIIDENDGNVTEVKRGRKKKKYQDGMSDSLRREKFAKLDDLVKDFMGILFNFSSVIYLLTN